LINTAAGAAIDSLTKARVQALAVQGDTSFSAGEYRKALDFYQQAIALKPDCKCTLYPLHVGAGRALTNLELLDRAMEQLNLALAMAPQSEIMIKPEAISIGYESRGRVHFLRKDYQAALADFSQAVYLSPENSSPREWRGVSYRFLEDFDQALTDYDWVLERFPAIPTSRANRAWIYAQQGKFAQAVADYNFLLEADPENPVYWNELALVYMKQGANGEALAKIDRALQLAPNYLPARENRALLLGRPGSFEMAISYYNRAIEQSPDHAWLWNDRGYSYLQRGMEQKALSDLNRALDLDPSLVIALENRINVFVRAGRYEEAVGDWDRLIEMEPDKGESYLGRGICLNRIESSVDVVLADLDRAEALGVSSRELYCQRGLALRKAGYGWAALPNFNRAIELDPEWAELYKQRARVYLRLGRLISFSRDWGMVAGLKVREYFQDLAGIEVGLLRQPEEQRQEVKITPGENRILLGVEADIRPAAAVTLQEDNALVTAKAEKKPEAIAAGQVVTEQEGQGGAAGNISAGAISLKTYDQFEVYDFQPPYRQQPYDLQLDGSDIWIAREGGLLRFRADRQSWSSYGKEEGFPADLSRRIGVFDHTVIASTYLRHFNEKKGYEYIADQRNYRFYPEKNLWRDIDLSCYPKQIDQYEDRIILACGDGIRTFDPVSGEKTGFTPQNSALIHKDVAGFMIEGSELITVGMGKKVNTRWRGGGVSLLELPDGKGRHFGVETGLADSYCYKVTTTPGKIWVAHYKTERGLSVYDRRFGNWKAIRESRNGIPLGGVAVQGVGDNLVIGQQGGLVFLNTKTMEAKIFKEADGLPGYIVQNLALGQDALWVLMYGYGHDYVKKKSTTRVAGLVKFKLDRLPFPSALPAAAAELATR
jgi:tetratricopeptide (TPR) repeat protein